MRGQLPAFFRVYLLRHKAHRTLAFLDLQVQRNERLPCDVRDVRYPIE